MSAPPPRRRLLHVPIVHTQDDLGSFAGEAAERMRMVLGAEGLARRNAAVVAFWSRLGARVLSLPLVWAETRVYQDGLPASGHELEIVRDLAAKGNANHKLLLEIVGRGATLEGTEDPALLLREYERIQRVARAARTGTVDATAMKRESEELLRQRDAFIARRIDDTLREGESGILFIGLLHRAEDLLRDRLDITSLRDNLPPGVLPWRRH